MCVLSSAAGFHVFPTFVLYELTILVVLTLSLVVMKVMYLRLSHSHSLTFSSDSLTHSLSHLTHSLTHSLTYFLI